MLEQKLQQRLLQKLSPQQIQVIKLLEIPVMQLDQRIKDEIEQNPVLEEGLPIEDYKTEVAEPDVVSEIITPESNFSIDEYLKDETPYYKLTVNNFSKDDKKTEIPFSTGSSFHEYLEEQLGMRSLTERQNTLAKFIIGNIDDDGYLRREIPAIVDDIAFLQNIETSEKELEELLVIIQDFDPSGVACRNLQECLLIQLKSKDKETPEIQHAIEIIADFFEEFTKKHFDKIKRRMEINDDELKDAMDEILKLNPKPGGSYNDPRTKEVEQIIPDFILEEIDGELQLNINQKNVPSLRINGMYAKMLEKYQKSKKKTRNDKEAQTYVKQKIESANWFIDAIRQRYTTMLLTMNEILKFQNEYFEEGDETKLKPMILKDIAEKTGLDISTISRVANSKYIQTHFGIFPLKYFFSEGMQTDSGEEVSTREIKQILKECIENESKKKPLTDDKLAKILQQKGYLIARRTIAKYREQLDIPVARLRKEL